MNGKLFLIVGPSGSGKGTVIGMLKEKYPNFVYPVSYTTREPRKGEKDGQSYHYISKAEFEGGITNGRFLEWAQVHKDNYYGTDKATIVDALGAGKVIIREIDIQGFKSIKEQLPSENLVSIFLEVTDLNDLRSRILGRSKLPAEEVTRRMESAMKEINESHLCDYKIQSIHGEVQKCFDDVEQVILDETDVL